MYLILKCNLCVLRYFFSNIKVLDRKRINFTIKKTTTLRKGFLFYLWTEWDDERKVYNDVLTSQFFFYFFLRFSACTKSVMGRPDMPQVPTPTRPPGPSGVAKMDFLTIPPFLVFSACKKNHKKFADKQVCLKARQKMKCLYRPLHWSFAIYSFQLLWPLPIPSF